MPLPDHVTRLQGAALRERREARELQAERVTEVEARARISPRVPPLRVQVRQHFREARKGDT